jgi:hypothetical protein
LFFPFPLFERVSPAGGFRDRRPGRVSQSLRELARSQGSSPDLLWKARLAAHQHVARLGWGFSSPTTLPSSCRTTRIGSVRSESLLTTTKASASSRNASTSRYVAKLTSGPFSSVPMTLAVCAPRGWGLRQGHPGLSDHEVAEVHLHFGQCVQRPQVCLLAHRP